MHYTILRGKHALDCDSRFLFLTLDFGSDMTYYGANAMSRPFIAAAKRTGFDLGLD